MEKDYWTTYGKDIVGEFGAYPNGAADLNGSIIFVDIVDLFVDSDDDSFEIESPSGDKLLRLRRARCFMFIQCFKRFFGKGKRGLLMAELEWFDKLDIYDKFLCPQALENSWMQRHKEHPIIRIPPFSGMKTPIDKFCWALKYDMPGKFIWNSNSSKAFKRWLKAYQGREQDLLVSCGMINCWEMVFYAAIRTGLLDHGRVMEAYKADDQTVAFGETFLHQMVQCFIVGEKVMTPDMKPVKSAEELAKQASDAVQKMEKKTLNLKPYELELGDIVVVDAFLEETAKPLISDPSGRFAHVAAVIEVGPKADDLENIKVTSLWESPPTTAIHPVRPILATVDTLTDKPGTKLVSWFWIIRLKEQ